MPITYMTKSGYKKKMEEIAYLESVKRPEISRAIAEARDKGDLSENSEYDAAKEAQGMLEMKISQLKDLVANCRIIDESNLNNEEVQILNSVTIKNMQNGDLLILDLFSECRPMWGIPSIWKRDKGYEQHDWLFCMLLNFGGSSRT